MGKDRLLLVPSVLGNCKQLTLWYACSSHSIVPLVRSAGLDRAAAAAQHGTGKCMPQSPFGLCSGNDGTAHDIELSKGECEPPVRNEGSDPPARAQHLRPGHHRREADVNLRVGKALASEDSGAQA